MANFYQIKEELASISFHSLYITNDNVDLITNESEELIIIISNTLTLINV